MRVSLFVTVIAAAALVLPGYAGATLGSASGGAASFRAIGPAGLTIEGTTKDVTVSEHDGKVSVTVLLARLDTGINVRNNHMREKYLETAKYPSTELVVDRSAITVPAPGRDVRASAPGQLTLHGQTRSVVVQYTAGRLGEALKVDGKARIDIRTFGIEVPSYLGATVKPDVDLEVHFVVTDQ